jgi:hypothetical protein
LPFGYCIDKNRRLVISIGTGRVIATEIRNHQNQLLRDPDFDPSYNQIIDMNAVSDLDISVADIATLARRPLFSRESRRAWVSSVPAIYGMGRLAVTHHEFSGSPSHASPFNDMQSALEWLGVDEQKTSDAGG